VIAQQNAAVGEQVTAASHSLVREIDGLAEVLGCDSNEDRRIRRARAA
jgi:hypothetical protein